MNSKSLRRLAADHGSLHTAGLPPNYLFPSSSDYSSDLTSLDILLVGPIGTPYSAGVWKLHLDIPPTYPAAPPTATFRTRLWHPNIDEKTGAVCVETLKRDWKPELKLRDVLVTISCLLIQPNPASALNEEAGKLANEDWDAFCRRAKLMAELYAGVPEDLKEGAKEAQTRGDDIDVEAVETEKKKGKSDELSGMKKGKGKEKISATPGPVTRKKRISFRDPLEQDEAENTKRGQTAELESDPESDWIPPPAKSTATKSCGGGTDGLGIRGLKKGGGSSARVIKATRTVSFSFDEKEHVQKTRDVSDPFVAPSKRSSLKQSAQVPSATGHHINKPVPHASPTKSPGATAVQPPSSELIDLTNPAHPMYNEFSWSFEDSDILYPSGLFKHATDAPVEVLKRHASDEFEQRRTEELKRFKEAGFDLKRYNRGDYGPRVGMGRL